MNLLGNINKKDLNKQLKDSNEIILLSVGLVWKEKQKAFIPVIAREIVNVINIINKTTIKLDKLKDNYFKVEIPDDNPIYFLKNNIFDNTEKLELNDWLNQQLVYIEKDANEIPSYLDTKSKEMILSKLKEEDAEVIKRNYSRQELNSDNFMLQLGYNEQEKISYILDKVGYSSINIKTYLNMLSSGSYDDTVESTSLELILLQDSFSKYILEFGTYISKEITDYLKEK